MAAFKAAYDRKDVGLLIDVRNENEFEDGFVPGAENVPRGLIEFRIWKMVGFPDKTDMNKKMTLYCATGGRCALATKSLQDLGFTNVTSVDMGSTTGEGWLSGRQAQEIRVRSGHEERMPPASAFAPGRSSTAKGGLGHGLATFDGGSWARAFRRRATCRPRQLRRAIRHS